MINPQAVQSDSSAAPTLDLSVQLLCPEAAELWSDPVTMQEWREAGGAQTRGSEYSCLGPAGQNGQWERGMLGTEREGMGCGMQQRGEGSQGPQTAQTFRTGPEWGGGARSEDKRR